MLPYVIRGKTDIKLLLESTGNNEENMQPFRIIMPRASKDK
jgi:hypothetical protein